MIVTEITELIGNTPLLKLKLRNSSWNVYCKLEKFNPGGSMKDRMALNMIVDAERRGMVKPGGTIIESSSGNTAIGLAMASAIRGYHFIAVVDHHASKDKIKMIKALGGEIVVVGDNYGEDEVAVIERERTAKNMAETMENAFSPGQADNVANREAYIDTLAVELLEDVENIDELYGAIGTGGSLCGTALGLKKYNIKATITAIEPAGSILFGGEGKPYFQSGTGNPVNAPIPKIIDYSLIDNNLYASDAEAFNTCRYFARKMGILIGGSSGGVLYKALQQISTNEGRGTAVILLCDGGERYLDTVYNDEWMINHHLIDETVSDNLFKWLEDK